MQKVKNTIPVIDICSLDSTNHLHEEVIAESFAPYLQKHQNLQKAHGHSFYHIVLFTEGNGYHTIDFEQFPVRKGQIYFMAPGQVHSWSFEGHTDGYVINFSEDLFHSLLNQTQYLQQFPFFRGVAGDSVIGLSGSAYETVLSAMVNIITEVQTKAVYNLDMVLAHLIALFITASRVAGPHAAHDTPPQNQLVLYNFRKLVDKYYAEKRLPKEYAALLYITPNHLNALCQKLLGKAAGEVIRDRILLEVKRLLINADISISEIAYRLSFTDNAHLTRFFKKHTHATPEEFRRSSIGKPKS